MRVLHEGKELPQETSLQWILDHVVATEALQQTADSSAGQIGDEAAARDPSSATITLHIAHCTPKGEAVQEAQVISPRFASEPTPRSPSSTSSEALPAVARHYANANFDRYWSRANDGAPARYTDTDCWLPGVHAAVVSTVAQLRARGTIVDAGPILAFMQDKAVRQYGEVKNGHKFKRPPSKKCMARYKSIADAWMQLYSQNQANGTMPEEITDLLRCNEGLQLPWKFEAGLCCSPRGQQIAATDQSEAQTPLPCRFEAENFETSFGLCEESEPLTPSKTSLQVDEVWLTSTISDLLPEASPDDLFFSNDSIMPAAAMAGAPPFLPFYTDAFPEVRWEGCPSNKRKRSNSDVA